jgi:hypothetical protein
MEYADKLGIDFLAKHRQSLEQALSPNYQAILDASIARRIGARDVAPASPVLAPPELLDDDAAEEEAAVASPPTAATEERMKEEAKEQAKVQRAAPKLDQASLGRGRPPAGGFSVTTGKCS